MGFTDCGAQRHFLLNERNRAFKTMLQLKKLRLMRKMKMLEIRKIKPLQYTTLQFGLSRGKPFDTRDITEAVSQL